MPRLAKTIAAVAAAAALTAVPAPAHAQTSCTNDPQVPSCVNYALDTAWWTLEDGQQSFNRAYAALAAGVTPDVRVPTVCDIYRKMGGRCISPPPDR